MLEVRSKKYQGKDIWFKLITYFSQTITYFFCLLNKRSNQQDIQ